MVEGTERKEGRQEEARKTEEGGVALARTWAGDEGRVSVRVRPLGPDPAALRAVTLPKPQFPHLEERQLVHGLRASSPGYDTEFAGPAPVGAENWDLYPCHHHPTPCFGGTSAVFQLSWD